MALSGPQARALRQRNGWSLQMLANLSDINKAYLSEFENGLRTLPDESLSALEALLDRGRPVGRARPELRREDGHHRLVFVDEKRRVVLTPDDAFIEWTESDGSTYRMFVGKR